MLIPSVAFSVHLIIYTGCVTLIAQEMNLYNFMVCELGVHVLHKVTLNLARCHRLVWKTKYFSYRRLFVIEC